MRRLSTARRHLPDLLARPPCGTWINEERYGALLVDPVEQLETLADLLARGLLSKEEFARQKDKVLEPWQAPHHR